MRMKSKMLLGSTALTVAAVVLTTIGVIKVTSDQAIKSLQAEVTDRLIVQRDTQKDRIEDYFRQINSEVSLQASMGGVFASALVEFSEAFPTFHWQAPKNKTYYKNSVKTYYNEQFGKNYLDRNSEATFISSDEVLPLLDRNAIALQNFYISDNPHPLGSKQKLAKISGLNTNYSRVHAKYHQKFTDYLNHHGFYDVFLIDAKTGNLIYSVFKELDFATSMLTGPYADSGIAQAFRKALEATEPGQTFITDMQPYYPSYNDYASFVSSPIYINGKIKGVFMVQMPIDRINQLMTFNKEWTDYGLGDSGETYLVADDKTMRNDSRFLVEDDKGFIKALDDAGIPDWMSRLIAKKNTTIGLMEVNSPGVRAALTGASGFDFFPDYRNIPVLSAYAPLDIPGVNWAILAEIDQSEVFAAINEMTSKIIWTAVIIGFVVLLIGLVTSLFFVRSFVSPMSHFKDVMQRFAKGERDVRVNLTADDEIGELASAFDKLLDEREQALEKSQTESDALNNSVIDMLQIAAKMSQGDLTVKMEVAENVTGPLADSINLVVNHTSKVITQVRATAYDVEQSANEVQKASKRVRKVSETELKVVNSAVNELSEAANELNGIVDLAKKCNQTADETINITDSAQRSVTDSVQGINNIRDNIRETEKRIKRLGERSQEIGGVIDLINGIAEKTHVLALNASMQAASAGEAGRGFAVVANEVQRLAENAREATMEISQQVKNIQLDTADTVTAMNKAISQVVAGSQMAEQSGMQMNATREKSYQLVNLVQQIAKRSEAQAQVAWNLQKQASEIQKTNAQTFAQTGEQAKQTESLVNYSARLLKAINVFKVTHSETGQTSKAINS